MATGEQIASGSRRWTRRRERQRRIALATLVAPTLLLLVLGFILPVVALFSYSAFHFNGMRIEYRFTFDAYPQFFTDPFYWDIVGRSLRLAAVVTFLALLVGYPTAYGISRVRSPAISLTLYILVFSPLLTSVIIRAFGWVIVLGESGVVNYLLVALHLVEKPIRLVYNFAGVTIALVHALLPFTVFPILSVLNQIDPTLKEAAGDLGANRWDTLWRITWPLSLPGLLSAGLTTFVLAVSAFATPSILGGGRVMVLPQTIFEGIITRDWPLAAVQGIVLLVITLTIVFLSNQLFRVIYRPAQEQGL